MSSLKLPLELIREIETDSLMQFHQAAQEISQVFTKRTVVALSGPMGAGKTEFVKAAVLFLAGVSTVASPTFAIHHRYQNENGPSIEHLDLFRSTGTDDLETTGFWDFFFETTGLIFIEWPEKMNLYLIPDSWDIFFIQIEKSDSSQSGESRKIILSRVLSFEMK